MQAGAHGFYHLQLYNHRTTSIASPSAEMIGAREGRMVLPYHIVIVFIPRIQLEFLPADVQLCHV